MSASKLLGITVPVELAKQLEELAKEDGRTVAGLVRKFIIDGIKQSKEGVNK